MKMSTKNYQRIQMGEMGRKTGNLLISNYLLPNILIIIIKRGILKIMEIITGPTHIAR